MAEKEYVVGIDLGTTNSAISWVKPDGNTEIIPNSEGKRVTPSIVSFSKEEDEILVGEPAKRQAILNSDNTVRSIKKNMGTDYTVNIKGKEYTPQQISAYILKKLVRDAEEYLRGKIKKAVITCPAYFNDAQRQATKEAGEIAGLEVLRVINEPTAASISFGEDKAKGEKQVAVYDLGGGTFDVSILDIGDDIIEVVSTAGNNDLGGDDFDQRVIDYLVKEFKNEKGIDLNKDKQALQRLKEAAESAKIELSTKYETDINLPFVTVHNGQPVHLEKKLTRSKFEELIRDLVDSTTDEINKALDDADLSKGDVDDVILVGGSTRIPIVQKVVKENFGKDPNKGVNPDEAVSLGAAIQSSIMTGDTERDLVLVDVTPLSLGVEVKGGLVENIIERNTKIPAKKSKVFTTAVDNQPEVEVHVVQGERTLAKDNHSLGSFKLQGIPPAPRGVPQIEVTFDIDSNGIVHVSAKDKGTGKQQSMQVSGRQKLSDEEINKMINEAKEYEEQDKKKKEQIRLKNEGEDLAYQTEKLINEQGENMSEDVKNNLQQKVQDLRNAISEDDTGKIKTLIDEIKKESQKVGQQVYQQQQQQQQQQQNAQQNPGNNGGNEETSDSNENVEDVTDQVSEDENKQ